jgi:hypothetical protein
VAKKIRISQVAKYIAENIKKEKRLGKKQALTQLVEGVKKSLLESPVEDFMGSVDAKLPDFVAMLKKVAADPEFQALAKAGKTDADPSDEVVNIEGGEIQAIKLVPTQAEIGLDASLADQMTDEWSATKFALGLKGTPIIMPSQEKPPPPILVWNGTYILDGHHRWSQVAMMNPTGMVKIDNMTSPNINSEEEALKIMQLAIAAAAGNVVTKDFEGVNLMNVTSEQIAAYVMENIDDTVLQLLVQAKKIPKPDKNLAAKYIAHNHKLVAKRPGKFSRKKSMPQAGKSGVAQDKVNAFLGTGAVNFNDPDLGDVKGKE